MNNIFIGDYKRECFELKLPFLTSREMHFEMDSTVDAISVMPADRILYILCLETTRHSARTPFAKLRPVKFISTQSFQRLNQPAF